MAKSPSGSPSMGSDAAFSAIPNPAYAGATVAVNPLIEGEVYSTTTPTKTDPTFMQNQISIKRSPSAAQPQIDVLSKKLSIQSNASCKSNASVNASISSSLHNALTSGLAASQELEARGRIRCDSDSSIVDEMNNCTLKKSNSNATDKSNKSIQSEKSVREVHAVGSYQYGSLRVHSPSPARKNGVDTHEILKLGDVVIVRDMTPGAIFGCDTMSLTIRTHGEFEGLKELPAGAHLIWANNSNPLSPRNGFWIMTSRRASDQFGEIHVKHWSTHDEILEEQFSAAEVRNQKNSLSEIVDKLKSYSLAVGTTTGRLSSIAGTSRLYAEDTNLWQHLTSCMKGPLLTKITGCGWNKWYISSSHDCKSSMLESYRVNDSMDYRKNEVLSFVVPAGRTWSTRAIGRDRTEQAMDTSSHIMDIISRNCTYEDSDEIIGELQFCYITGMTLGNAACQEQWAVVVKVLFRAYRLALEQPVFLRKAIEALHAQLIYDDAFFDNTSIFDVESGLRRQLKNMLITFKSRLNELLLSQGKNLTDQQIEVGKAFDALEAWLCYWDWDLRGNYVRSGKIQLEDGEWVDAELRDFEAEDERGEFAPMVVSLGDERDMPVLRVTQ